MERNVVTNYYFRRQTMKVNRAVDPEAAVLHCVRHMRQNSYGSTVAEVVDKSNFHELVAVVTRNVNGRISIVYHREYNPDGRRR
ncbi:hypothetical protein [Ralstonia phage RP13]|nr:hypothetical protein [Ralstonia phage RP13]